MSTKIKQKTTQRIVLIGKSFEYINDLFIGPSSWKLNTNMRKNLKIPFENILDFAVK